MGERKLTTPELVEEIFRHLVNDPDSVSMVAVEGDYSTVIEVSVRGRDFGRALGRHGLHAEAIRKTFLRAIGGREKKRYVLEMIEG